MPSTDEREPHEPAYSLKDGDRFIRRIYGTCLGVNAFFFLITLWSMIHRFSWIWVPVIPAYVAVISHITYLLDDPLWPTRPTTHRPRHPSRHRW